MPHTTLLDIPQQEQDQMLAALRRARYGYLLALHVLLLCAAWPHIRLTSPPSCSARAPVSTASSASIALSSSGFTSPPDGQLRRPVRTHVLMPWCKRSLGALLKAPPRAYGWCRTRWSCATLAPQLKTKHGLQVSRGPCGVGSMKWGWVWKRAKLVAKDNDPQRVERLARIRFHAEHLQAHEVMVFADELDIHLLPKVGRLGCPKGARRKS